MITNQSHTRCSSTTTRDRHEQRGEYISTFLLSAAAFGELVPPFYKPQRHYETPKPSAPCASLAAAAAAAAHNHPTHLNRPKPREPENESKRLNLYAPITKKKKRIRIT